jgi:LPS O-antigen subunit length determinant protein (WzzB/FepE family)
MIERPVDSRDEIELIEIFRIIWKWKYLILAGTLVCALIAAVVNLNKPETYRINMLIQPGIREISKTGKVRYADSPANIKAVIEAGSFNEEILKYLRSSPNQNIPRSFNFDVKIPRKSNILQVFHESSNRELGIDVMNELSSQILIKYNDQIDYNKNVIDTEIKSNKSMLIALEGETRFLQENIKSVQEIIDELKKQIKILDVTNNEHIMYLYNNQINTYLNMIRNDRIRITKLRTQISELSEEIKNLEYEKNQIRGIEVLQAPAGSARPVKRKIALTVVLASVGGVVVMSLLAFFIEYILKYRARELE